MVSSHSGIEPSLLLLLLLSVIVGFVEELVCGWCQMEPKMCKSPLRRVEPWTLSLC